MDGYIARRDGSLDWLTGPAGTEDYGYGRFMETVDAVILGRNTYDAVLGFGAWPFADKDVHVLTHRPMPGERRAHTHCGPLAPLLEKLREASVRRVYLDGGKAVQQGLKEGLVHDLTVTVAPVLLGDGIRLFDSGMPTSDWRTVGVEAFSSGFMQLRWESRRAP
jgi:dihydrofolate reductase